MWVRTLVVAIRMTIAAVMFALAACLPFDPEGTTDAVRGGTLKVGVLTPSLSGQDRLAVERVANWLDAELEIRDGDAHELFALLETGRLHIVTGRLPKDTPFADHVALSNPIGRIQVAGKQPTDQVLALRQGENRFIVEVNRALKGVQQ